MFASMFKTVLPLSLALISGTTLPSLTSANRAPNEVAGPTQDELSIQGRFRRDRSDRQTHAISLIGLLGSAMDDGRGGIRATTCADIMAALDAADLAHDARILDTESMLYIRASADRATAAASLIDAMRTTREAASQLRALNAAACTLRTHASLLVNQARDREDAVRRMSRQADFVTPLVRQWLDLVTRDACADVRRMQAYEQAVLTYASDPSHYTQPADPGALSTIPGLPVGDTRLEHHVRELERSLECALREREESENRVRCAIRDLDRVRNELACAQRELECARRDLEKARCEARDARKDLNQEREEARRREACLQRTIDDLKRQLDRRQSSFGGDHKNEMGPKRDDSGRGSGRK